MIKKLMSFIGEYKRNTILSPIFVALEVVMDITIPLMMSFLLSKGIEAHDNSQIIFYGVIIILMALAGLTLGALSGVQCAKAAGGFAKNLRKNMFYRIQNFSFKNIDKFSASGIVTRTTTDITFVQTAFQMIIRVAVRCPLMLIFGIIMTAIISGWLSVIFVVVIPLIMFALILIFKKAFPLFQKLFKRYDRLNCVVEENIRGMRVVKTYVRQEHETAKFKAASDDIYKQFSHAQRIVVLSNPLMQLSMYICIMLLGWFGSKMVISSAGLDLNPSELATLFTYSTQILMSLMMFSMVYVNVAISRASAQRICEVLDEEPDVQNPQKPVYEVVNGSIEFKNVSFSYKKEAEKASLKDINLNINSGETIGIIGGTGSSKTTLVQLIPRLYDATMGEILIGGVNVKSYDLFTLRKAVAMVLQKNLLFSGTLRDNMRWGNENASDEEIHSALSLACAEEFVSKMPLGLDTFIEQGGSNVSGGQKQRLCIARALLAKPKILILDDSTSAVDMNTDIKIRRAFKEQIPQTTKLIIAQRVASVVDADKIIVLEGGKIVEQGSHAELMKNNGLYAEIYNSQTEGGDFDE